MSGERVVQACLAESSAYIEALRPLRRAVYRLALKPGVAMSVPRAMLADMQRVGSRSLLTSGLPSAGQANSALTEKLAAALPTVPADVRPYVDIQVSDDPVGQLADRVRARLHAEDLSVRSVERARSWLSVRDRQRAALRPGLFVVPALAVVSFALGFVPEEFSTYFFSARDYEKYQAYGTIVAGALLVYLALISIAFIGEYRRRRLLDESATLVLMRLEDGLPDA